LTAAVNVGRGRRPLVLKAFKFQELLFSASLLVVKVLLEPRLNED